MTTVTRMYQEQWERRYSPLKNHLRGAGAFGGCLYQPYGLDDEYVRHISNATPSHVWTVVHCDEGYYILSGWHYVNVIGYLITLLPAEGDVEVDLND